MQCNKKHPRLRRRTRGVNAFVVPPSFVADERNLDMHDNGCNPIRVILGRSRVESVWSRCCLAPAGNSLKDARHGHVSVTAFVASSIRLNSMDGNRLVLVLCTRQRQLYVCQVVLVGVCVTTTHQTITSSAVYLLMLRFVRLVYLWVVYSYAIDKSGCKVVNVVVDGDSTCTQPIHAYIG